MNGRDNNGRFVKGHKTNIGRHHTEETKKKISKNEDRKEKIRQAFLGEKNHQWKGGISDTYTRNLALKTLRENCITVPKGCDVHHKDRNRMNYDITNLLVISRSEHTKLHWKQGKTHKKGEGNY